MSCYFFSICHFLTKNVLRKVAARAVSREDFGFFGGPILTMYSLSCSIRFFYKGSFDNEGEIILSASDDLT